MKLTTENQIMNIQKLYWQMNLLIIRCSDGTVEEVKENIERVISELGDEGAGMNVEVC